MLVICGFQSGETSSIPGTCVPHAPGAISAYTAFAPLVAKRCSYQYGTASEEPVSVTDEKPTLISVGLMGQVASSRPYPPSSREGSHRETWMAAARSTRSLTLRLIEWAAGSSVRSLKHVVKGSPGSIRSDSQQCANPDEDEIFERGIPLQRLRKEDAVTATIGKIKATKQRDDEPDRI